ncbi:1-aminocyclopropane-1-carboxylate synthase-like protein 1 [Takifugu flavidus]|nr:1-aminocyclopropane-1-carboxylate synthase-like protein 1 [Takifugu flavidus]
MDFRGRRHERGSNWTDPEIVELLQLWSDESVQIELESSLRNQRVFDRIAHILRERGIYRTGDQCREKIKKMKLEYRRIKDNLKMRSWKFYDVMDRVLANRPAITYSSLGGTVIAQQVFQNQGSPLDAHGPGGAPGGTFGPVSSGGFLFGQPPKPENPLDIKCEDVGDDMMNSGDSHPGMYYCSGDDQDNDGQSLMGPEDAVGRGESSTAARISPSGFSDLNIASSSTAASQDAAPPQSQDAPEQPQKLCRPLTSARQKKRHRGGKTLWDCGKSCGGQGRLDKALSCFLSWQQSAEERLLSLEEARLERELQEEERRERREERRAEQERQHELRLFGMLTEALVAVRQGTQTPAAQTTCAPSTMSSSSRPPLETLQAQSVSAEETPGSALPACAQPCETARSATPTGGETPNRSRYLSHRGNSIRQQQGILQEGFLLYSLDKFHETDKPDGIINLGTSENKLCHDLLHERLTRPDMLQLDPPLLQYPDWSGHQFLREEVAKFLTDYCCSPKPLKAENVVVMNGCASLFSCIASVICDPKDAILISTPFYGAITEHLGLYSDVKLYHIHLDCEASGEDGRLFHLTVDKLEEGLRRAEHEGFIVRGLVLMNPHNPLADIYTPKEMVGFLEFAKRNELHTIVDEVYMLSVFDESVTFDSVLSLESVPDPQRTHVMWGLGKDFAMAGIRVGTLYSESRDLVEAVAKLGAFHGVPGTTQRQVAQLLQDREWIDTQYLPRNRSRLKAAHSYVTGELRGLDVPYLDRSAAMFVWADLRKFLAEPSFEEELRLWRHFLKHKVVLSCGQAFSCSTPGWFRIVFSDQDRRLKLGMKRIKEALEEYKDQITVTDCYSIKDGGPGVRASGKDSDNAAIVGSTLPQGKSSDMLEEKDHTVQAGLGADELVLRDCQPSKPAEGLDSLIGTLRHQIRSSDWLEKNTPELSAGEDPEILDVFKALLERARK